MSTIIVKKNSGDRVSGEDIAKENWFCENSEDNTIFPPHDFYGPQVLISPTDKVCYLIAELNTMAEKVRNGGDEAYATELFEHIVELETQFANYIPGCSGFYRYNKWYRFDIPEKKLHLYPKYDYGHVPQQVGILSDFLKECNVEEFDFICDSHYIIVLEGQGTNWEAMKHSGLIDINKIEREYMSLE